MNVLLPPLVPYTATSMIATDLDVASGKVTVSAGGAVGLTSCTFTMDAGSKASLKGALAIAISDVALLQAALDAKASIAAVAAGYQPLNGNLTAIATLTTTAYGRGFLVLADAAAGRTALGLTSAATGNASGLNSGTIDISLLPALPAYATIVAANLAALTTEQQASIVTGTRVITQDDGREQRYTGPGSKTDAASYTFVADASPDWTLLTNKPANILSLAGLTLAADRGLYATGSGTLALFTLTGAGRDLLDDADAAAMQVTLNLIPGTHVQTYRVELTKTGIHGTDIASSGAIDLESATGDLVDVTGITAITAITLSEGHVRRVRFQESLLLTNGSDLVLLTGTNITTQAGDFAVFAGYASGVVRMLDYQRADGTPLVGGGGGGSSPWVARTVADDAATLADGDRIAADVNGGSFSQILPASPSFGAEIWIMDSMGLFGTFTLTIGNGGQNIEGVNEDLICDQPKALVRLVYVGGSKGWRVSITP